MIPITGHPTVLITILGRQSLAPACRSPPPLHLSAAAEVRPGCQSPAAHGLLGPGLPSPPPFHVLSQSTLLLSCPLGPAHTHALVHYIRTYSKSPSSSFLPTLRGDALPPYPFSPYTLSPIHGGPNAQECFLAALELNDDPGGLEKPQSSMLSVSLCLSCLPFLVGVTDG